MASGVEDCKQRTHRRAPRLSFLRRLRKDDSGMTAVEFGIVAMPFMMLLFGIISVCLYFFTNFTLENAVWHTARALRTGQVQQAKGAYSSATTTEDKKNAFKAALCALAPHFLTCNKIVVIVQSSASFGGIVEKFIGDAVVTVFGIPNVHEDDAERAVRCALAMHDALAGLNDTLRPRFGVELVTRIGINTGVALASPEALATGDVMNTAARLEQAASPGEILVHTCALPPALVPHSSPAVD